MMKQMDLLLSLALCTVFVYDSEASTLSTTTRRGQSKGKLPPNPICSDDNPSNSISTAWKVRLSLLFICVGLIAYVIVFKRKWVKEKIRFIFKQKVEIELLSKSIIIGILGGIFPIPAVATGVGFLLSFIFGVHYPIMCATMILAWPLQFAFFLEFAFFGDYLKALLYSAIGWQHITLDGYSLKHAFDYGVISGIKECTQTLAWASLAWMVVTPIPAVLSYHALKPLFAKIASKWTQGTEERESPSQSVEIDMEEETKGSVNDEQSDHIP